MNEVPREPNPIKRIIGLVLIAAGALWIAASGLCTAAFFVSLFTEASPGAWQELASIVPMVLLVGGFSAGLGVVAYVVGRALRPKG